MNEIFLIILSLSISGSLIALLLLLLRPIIKDRLSKTWQYYIFLIVIIRLLLPFGPEFSLMGMIFNQFESHITTTDVPTSASDTVHFLRLPDETPEEQTNNESVSMVTAQEDRKETLLGWWWLAWLVPAILLLIRKLVRYYRQTRFIKNSSGLIDDIHLLNMYRETCKIMGIKHAPSLAKNERVPAPMIVGIVQPMVILPDTSLKDTDIRLVMQHELTHYKRLDIVYKWLVQIALCIHWFNPVVYWVSREINRNCELSCDEAVIKCLDKKSRFDYGDMLLNAIKIDKMPSHTTVSLLLSDDAKRIKERLKAIMTYKKQSHKLVMVSVLLAVCLLFGAVCVGSYTASAPNSVQQIPTDVVTPSANNITGTQTQTTPLEVAKNPAIIEEMEMRYYEDDDPDGRWPYLHWIITNNSDKTITDYEMACLAYDKDGNPLELIWQQIALTDGNKVTGFTSQSDESYEWIITEAEKPLLPGEKEDLNGGWSLWDGWNQSDGSHEVAYVLACMKQITFDDGTVWENPEYQNWLSTYKAQSIAPEILHTFYGA